MSVCEREREREGDEEVKDEQRGAILNRIVYAFIVIACAALDGLASVRVVKDWGWSEGEESPAFKSSYVSFLLLQGIGRCKPHDTLNLCYAFKDIVVLG